MKVDFNFGTTAEITLTPESPKEESLVKMAYETQSNPYILRNGDNKVRIIFDSTNPSIQHKESIA